MRRPHDHAVTTSEYKFHYEFLRSMNVHATLIRSLFHQRQKGDTAIGMPDVTDALPMKKLDHSNLQLCLQGLSRAVSVWLGQEKGAVFLIQPGRGPNAHGENGA